MKSVDDRLGRDDLVWIDSDGHIESEWRAGVEPEWFTAWFSARLAADAIRYVSRADCRDLIKRLVVDCGFPGQSRDRRYIEAAKGVCDEHGPGVVLLSEDLDFYEPKEKGCGHKRYRQILGEQRGCVVRTLRKRADIEVRSVAVHLVAVGP